MTMLSRLRAHPDFPISACRDVDLSHAAVFRNSNWAMLRLGSHNMPLIRAHSIGGHSLSTLPSQ